MLLGIFREIRQASLFMCGTLVRDLTRLVDSTAEVRLRNDGIIVVTLIVLLWWMVLTWTHVIGRVALGTFLMVKGGELIILLRDVELLGFFELGEAAMWANF